ncbi:hypothetical protein D3C74_135380 [compost metagenome]
MDVVNTATLCDRINLKIFEKPITDGSGIMRIRKQPVENRKYNLFPYNHIDVVNLEKAEEKVKKLYEFKILIEKSDTNERDILNYINSGEYHLIGGIVKNGYFFGHHSAYLFPEFQLGNDYKVDYLVIGKNSDGYHFLLIELEAIYGNITTKDGDFGKAVRSGLSQIDDWKSWIEGNHTTFTRELLKYKNDERQLPSVFYTYDSSRFNYAVIGGRREDFKYEKTRRKQRESWKVNGIRILHYDNIIDRTLDWVTGHINRWHEEEMKDASTV